LAQTYQNWDYTIVNNCSTDKTLEIARKYAAKDSRIRVHDNSTFLGMLPNHNLALRQISPESKYCKVVLADDYIYPSCLEQMVALAEANPSVGVVSAYQRFGEQIQLTGLPQDQTVVNAREVSRLFFLQSVCLFGTQNSVLYRADLVRGRDPFYLETETCCSDWDVCFVLSKLSDFGFVHQILTYTRVRPACIGAISWDMGANFGSQIALLFSHGREHLTPQEFDECLERQLSKYYSFLGRRAFLERSGEFWSYHEKTLARFGLRLSRARLAKAAVAELSRQLLNPEAAWTAVKRAFSLKKLRNAEMRKVVSGFGRGAVDHHNDPVARS